jgi:hypothetical protein
VVIDGLHKQRPGLLAQLTEARFGQRPVLERQGSTRARDQAGFYFARAGEARQLIGLERVGPRRPRVPDQQRLLLPDVAQETVDVARS